MKKIWLISTLFAAAFLFAASTFAALPVDDLGYSLGALKKIDVSKLTMTDQDNFRWAYAHATSAYNQLSREQAQKTAFKNFSDCILTLTGRANFMSASAAFYCQKNSSSEYLMCILTLHGRANFDSNSAAEVCLTPGTGK